MEHVTNDDILGVMRDKGAVGEKSQLSVREHILRKNRNDNIGVLETIENEIGTGR